MNLKHLSCSTMNDNLGKRALFDEIEIEKFDNFYFCFLHLSMFSVCHLCQRKYQWKIVHFKRCYMNTIKIHSIEIKE